jgi:hypothetical protein
MSKATIKKPISVEFSLDDLRILYVAVSLASETRPQEGVFYEGFVSLKNRLSDILSMKEPHHG